MPKIRFVKGHLKGSVAFHSATQAAEFIKAGVAVRYVRDPAVVERDRVRSAEGLIARPKRGR